MKRFGSILLVCGLLALLTAVPLSGCGEDAQTAAPDQLAQAEPSGKPETGEAVTKADILGGDPAGDGAYLRKALHGGFTEDGNTIFETIDGNWIVPGRYDPDNLYLLTLYKNGTEDPADDEVSVIWGTCQPMDE